MREGKKASPSDVKGACAMYTKKMLDDLLEKMADDLENINELKLELDINMRQAFFTTGYATYDSREEMEEDLEDRKAQLNKDYMKAWHVADELEIDFDGYHDEFILDF